ncbi:MFS transporter [Zhihengliuella halotolerans]|uniref:DHA2 family multidrug resistance protein-like MFS transporter n=1 Tax=Zhihengliuella halotolerans TaxID=370736 RepID=A0A4Q8AE66_9MICC|nr:MFS transporter [Zhihengliuella halotolerans]RZU62552.1 DHA2 family multidrug resistance protein-like MFS transporter [Zhihengliuella halotolerans]
MSVQTAATHTELSGTRRWLALAVLMFPVLLISIDNTVLSFAVPALSRALAPDSDELLWIIDIYPLVLAGLLVPMGSLGDRIGRKRLLLIGSIGFAAVSALAAFAPNAQLLIAARALLGLFGSMLMPATLSLIRNIFTDVHERRRAIAIWASGFSGGAVLGPVLGGWLLEHFWWGSIFLLAVPMLLPILIAGPALVPESKDPNPGPIDPLSIVLVVAALTPLVFGIKVLAKGDGLVVPAVAIALGIASGVVFVRRQLARAARPGTEPMLDVRLFKNPMFSGALTVNLLSVFALVGFIYFLTQHVQLVAGYSPLEAGLMMIPGLSLAIASGLLAANLAKRFRVSTLMVVGLLLNAAAYTMVFFVGESGSVLLLMASFCVLSAGVGLAETLSNDLALSAVPPEKAGAASAISETAYETGAVLGTAVLGSLLNAAYTRGLILPGGMSAGQEADASKTLGGAHEVAESLPASQAAELLENAASAFDSGVMLTAGIGAALALAAAVVIHRALRMSPQRG